MTTTRETNVFVDVARYFEALTEQLKGESRQAAILHNSPVVGGDREEVYRRFLERHLPATCEVFRGGYVFNMDGHSSGQIDIIVTSGLTPRFNMGSGKQAISPVEGAIAIAEVKSKLTKNELIKTLNSFRRLPTFNEENASFNPQLRAPDTVKWNMPYKTIFAYDGIRKELIFRYINEYYLENPDTPHHCRPSLIHVLGKYAILRMMPGIVILDPDGTRAQEQSIPGQYWWFNRKSDIIAMMDMFTTIQENAFKHNHLMVKYQNYLNRMADVILRTPQ